MGILDKVKDRLIGGSGASWRDRVRPASYKSPTGRSNPFLYYDLSRSYTLRGEVWEFADLDGGYVQRNGVGPRRYPILAIFSGANHDREALAFEGALNEAGRGVLNHPLHGPIDVIPLGEVTRRDELRTAANQTIIEVTFWTSLASVYPAAGIDQANEILAQLGAFRSGSAAKLGILDRVNNAAQRASALSRAQSSLTAVDAILIELTNTSEQLRRAQARQMRALEGALHTLITRPLEFVESVAALILGPAEALSDLVTKTETYAELGASTRAGSDASGDDSADPRVRARAQTDFLVEDMFTSMALAGAVQSTVSEAQPLKTRKEAVESADRLLTQLEETQNWRDEREQSLDSLDTLDDGEAFGALQQATLLAVSRLIESSFSLIQERAVVVDRNRTIIDLAAQLYGDVDNETLDRLIVDNQLSGSEILEVPRGRKIVYYPAA